jgi:hypothetical protein
VAAVLGVLAVLLFTATMVWALGPHESNDGGGTPSSDLSPNIVPGETPTTVAPTTVAESAPASG